MDFDVLVVGAGVAGCATALELQSSGWRVGVLHRRNDVFAIESLAPGVVRELDKLSIHVGSTISEVVAWWGSARPVHAIHSGARIIEREALADALRMRAIENGVIVIDGRLLTVEHFENGWSLACDNSYGDSSTNSRQVPRGRDRSVVGDRASVRFETLYSRRSVLHSVSVDEPNILACGPKPLQTGGGTYVAYRSAVRCPSSQMPKLSGKTKELFSIAFTRLVAYVTFCGLKRPVNAAYDLAIPLDSLHVPDQVG